MNNDGGFSYTIGGVRVQFPFKPYPSQMAMMAQIIKGLQRRQNCLLESPTGSGKSLALLCSTIAWLQAEEDRCQRYNDLLDQGITDPDILGQIIRPVPSTQSASNVSFQNEGVSSSNDRSTNRLSTSTAPSTSRPSPTGQTPSRSAFAGPLSLNEIMAAPTEPNISPADTAVNSDLEGGFIRDDDFKEPNTRFRVRDATGDVTVVDEAEGFVANSTISLDDIISIDNLNNTTASANSNQQQPWLKKRRAPKIFFGTRTHKQIYQITKELRRTNYKRIKSVVLGSREHTCIHPTVSKSTNKNEQCRALRDNKDKEVGDFCIYDHGVNRMMSHDMINSLGIRPAWDLEDLIKIGKKVRGCPYYASRKLMETAQLIICPYNYLIDPLIRSSMNINLNGNILVLDEAHNVEDCARDASSASITQEQILDSRNDLEKLSTMKCNLQACVSLITFLTNLSNWMEAHQNKLTDYSEFGRSSKIFSGSEMIKAFDVMDIGPAALLQLDRSLDELNKDPENDEEPLPKPAAATTQLFKGLFLMLQYLFKGNMKYSNDYKVALIKTQIKGKAPKKNVEGWLGTKKTTNIIFSINFWCLNPGVSFSEIGEIARSIILTSGTLSPMDTFESELQVKFHVQLEANHVISKNQVWVGTLASGPTNHPLNSSYQHSETWAFQDELGKAVLEICEAVPRGVLCFLPSYSMLQKLADRWQSTSIWDSIQCKKVIITEPRKAEEFEEAMKLFYSTIEVTKNCSETDVNGVFFMAVCRGKVSEGLDFTDDNARAVIAVGIPFPNFKDIQVDLKRQYNNIYYKSRGLLSGSQWYEIQAYRALNQALGRCIRHRYDWGALILIDERYQKGWVGEKHVKGLSKWVRNNLNHQPNFQTAIIQIQDFAKQMTENPPQSPNDPVLNSTNESSAGIMALPKPKFASPPQIANSIKEIGSSTLGLTFGKSEVATKFSFFGKADKKIKSEGPLLAIPGFLHLDKEEKKPPQDILVLQDDISLTPISGMENCLSTQDENVPKTSTQVNKNICANQVIFPFPILQQSPGSQTPNWKKSNNPRKGDKVVYFLNVQTTELPGEQRLASIFTPASKLSGKMKLCSVTESQSKKSKLNEGAEITSPNGSIMSHNRETEDLEADHSLSLCCNNKKDGNNSDDMFSDEENFPKWSSCVSSFSEKRKSGDNSKTSMSNYFSPLSCKSKLTSKPSHGPNNGKHKVNSHSQTAEVSPLLETQLYRKSTQIGDLKDADLDDFQSEDSMTRVKRRVIKGRRSIVPRSLNKNKGIEFVDLDS